MDLGWVGMTQVWSEEVRTSRWTPSGTTGGTSGSTSISLKFSDGLKFHNVPHFSVWAPHKNCCSVLLFYLFQTDKA